MAAALYTDVKRKGPASAFTRPACGLFGLAEWEPSGPALPQVQSRCCFSLSPVAGVKSCPPHGVTPDLDWGLSLSVMEVLLDVSRVCRWVAG